MDSNFGFVVASYALVVGTTLAYTIWMRGKAARLRSELRSGPSAPGAHGHRVDTASEGSDPASVLRG
jgi:hypothetical protein